MSGHAHESVNCRRRTANVEHRLQHSGHRTCGARTHGHQQRAAVVAEHRAGGTFKKFYSFMQAIDQLMPGMRIPFDDRGT